jgi:hypothetical protein
MLPNFHEPAGISLVHLEIDGSLDFSSLPEKLTSRSSPQPAIAFQLVLQLVELAFGSF